MPRAQVSTGVEIEYETMGDPAAPPLLLVMGFTAQLIAWHDEFCAALVEAGHHVVRFDNRDCGLSTKLDGVAVDTGSVFAASAARQSGQDAHMPEVPYTLSDMAADAVGLLDALGIESAHVVGASMGGMIVQHMAIEHAERVRSMTSVMSTTGELAYGSPDPAAISVLLAEPPADRDAYIASSVDYGIWQSKRYFDADEVRRQAARAFDRSFYPEGGSRQLAAIYASGSRAEGLATLDVPTLVVHGRDDTLITPSGGQRTAELVPGATLLMAADMGHDLPRPLWPLVVGAISAHTRRAD
jgi:pimeloyl-ACP methyl ester carboxylesterase